MGLVTRVLKQMYSGLRNGDLLRCLGIEFLVTENPFKNRLVVFVTNPDNKDNGN